MMPRGWCWPRPPAPSPPAVPDMAARILRHPAYCDEARLDLVARWHMMAARQSAAEGLTGWAAAQEAMAQAVAFRARLARDTGQPA